MATKKLRPFDTLSKTQQIKLVAHFCREFAMSKPVATRALRDCTKPDLELHTEACNEGYI